MADRARRPPSGCSRAGPSPWRRCRPSAATCSDPDPSPRRSLPRSAPLEARPLGAAARGRHPRSPSHQRRRQPPGARRAPAWSTSTGASRSISKRSESSSPSALGPASSRPPAPGASGGGPRGASAGSGWAMPAIVHDLVTEVDADLAPRSTDLDHPRLPAASHSSWMPRQVNLGRLHHRSQEVLDLGSFVDLRRIVDYRRVDGSSPGGPTTGPDGLSDEEIVARHPAPASSARAAPDRSDAGAAADPRVHSPSPEGVDDDPMAVGALGAAPPCAMDHTRSAHAPLGRSASGSRADNSCCGPTDVRRLRLDDLRPTSSPRSRPPRWHPPWTTSSRLRCRLRFRLAADGSVVPDVTAGVVSKSIGVSPGRVTGM